MTPRFDWYLARSEEAAVRFAGEFDRTVAQITQSPERWTSGPFHTRRFLLSRFPFILVYRCQSGGTIQILALAHTSRKPEYWKTRR